MNTSIPFGNIIRDLRIKKGMPLRKVATFLGIDPATLSKVERGERSGNRDMITKLSKLFLVNRDELLISLLSDKIVDDLGKDKISAKVLIVAGKKINSENTKSKKIIPYSQIKKRLNIDSFKKFENDLACFTHFLQNHENGVSKSYKKAALAYYKEISNQLSIVEEPPLQTILPLKWDIPFPPPVSQEFTFIELFAGIGGFRIPLQEANGKCVFTSEFNFHAQRAYELNFGEVPFGDITKLDLNIVPKHDVLTAGFPCQPFSISGKMKGFEDTRGTLIYYVFKIIEMRQPKVVLLENVKHLLHHDGGNTLKTIIKDLEGLGYIVSSKVLNASDFGVPQNRERIIIIGHKTKKFDFTKLKTKPKPILKNFLEKDSNFEFLNEPYTLIKDYKVQESGLIFIGYRNKKIRKAGVRPGTENLSRVHKQPNRIYSTEGVHPALPSQESSGRFWIYHNGNVRKLTIKECYNIMGFPDEFKMINNTSELYRQVGNSVCVPMIEEIINQIKEQLL